MARDQAVAAAISVALIAAVLSPVARAPADDGFPLSTYPMFAIRREPVQTLVYAVGVTGEGARRPIAPARVGTGEVLQAAATIANAVGGGSATSRALCERIAAAVASDGGGDDRGDDDRGGDRIARVQIVTGTHDAFAYLAGRADPSAREVIDADCAVAR